MNLLHTIGLMTRAEHERVVRGLESQLALRENAFEAIEADRDRISDKFKRAATDLAAQAEEIAALEKRLMAGKRNG